MLSRRDFLLSPLTLPTDHHSEVEVRVAGENLASGFNQRNVQAWAQLFWERVFVRVHRDRLDLSQHVLVFRLVRRIR